MRESVTNPFCKKYFRCVFLITVQDKNYHHNPRSWSQAQSQWYQHRLWNWERVRMSMTIGGTLLCSPTPSRTACSCQQSVTPFQHCCGWNSLLEHRAIQFIKKPPSIVFTPRLLYGSLSFLACTGCLWNCSPRPLLRRGRSYAEAHLWVFIFRCCMPCDVQRCMRLFRGCCSPRRMNIIGRRNWRHTDRFACAGRFITWYMKSEVSDISESWKKSNLQRQNRAIVDHPRIILKFLQIVVNIKWKHLAWGILFQSISRSLSPRRS